MKKYEYIFIDAISFDDYGEWKKDTQFSHIMGSGYLLACHQPGVCVKDAKKSVDIKKEGRYRVWVRTKNWYFPYAPGVFTISVNGKESTLLGNSPTHDWYWHLAGDFDFKCGKNELCACDKSGYFGRFSSVIITDDFDFVPKRPVSEFEIERADMLGLDLSKKNIGTYDVIVCGAGPGGCPAAISASRHGAKTLLISGRPVLGGNASDEIDVHFSGAEARQVNAREGGIGEEIIRTSFYRETGWQGAMEELCAAEENLTVIYNYFVCGAECENNTISSITAKNIEDGTYITAEAKEFIDCTGDGWLGYYAGARFRLGREAKWQYNEEFAPENPDTCTMSGCTMGAGPIFKKLDKKSEYIAPDWVPKFPAGDEYGRNIEDVVFVWWLEAPNTYDDVYDAEMARDELFRINIGHFNYLKNLWDFKERAENYVLWRMPYIDGKRESRRFVGDYTLTQNDAMTGRDFDDAVLHTGWPIDLHNPKGIYSGKEGPFFSNTHIPLTKVPFRCLYSVNINNLLFAGRCASVSHIALGTARLENTISCEGQAVGLAAAVCVQKGITPRDIYKNHLKEFRQMLLKDDQYIPGLKNEDKNDLALTASITASSEEKNEIYYPHTGYETDGYELNMQRATFFPRDVSNDVASVWTKFTNKNDFDSTVTLHIRVQSDPDGYTTPEDLRVVKITIPKNTTDWFEVPINYTTSLRYLWIWTEKCDGVWWHTWKMPPLDYARSERNCESERFENIRRESHCVLLKEPDIGVANCSASNVINGYGRIVDHERYEWVSEKGAAFPQWIELDLKEKTDINSVYITFDTDMTNPSCVTPVYPYPPCLVKDYEAEVFDGKNWIKIADEKDNFRRRRIHRFEKINAEKVRITVKSSVDGIAARIFEVRIYNE